MMNEEFEKYWNDNSLELKFHNMGLNRDKIIQAQEICSHLWDWAQGEAISFVAKLLTGSPV